MSRSVGRRGWWPKGYLLPDFSVQGDKPDCIGTSAAVTFRDDYYTCCVAEFIRAEEIPLSTIGLLVNLDNIKEGISIIYLYGNDSTSAWPFRPPEGNLIRPAE